MAYPTRLGLIDSQEPVERDHPLNAALVAWWLGLDNTWGGSTLHDLCGKYPGTLTNGPTWSPGPHGFGGLTFDGSNDTAIAAVASGTIFGASPSGVSVSWWQRPTVAHNSSTTRGLWGSTSSGVRPEFSAQVFSDNNWYVGFNAVSDDDRVILAASSTNWVVNQWSHYTFTAVIGGTSSLYRNGALLGSNGGSTTYRTPSDAFRVGYTGSGGTVHFTGTAGDWMMHARALSAAEVHALYEQSLRGHPDTLRRYSTTAWYVPASGGGSAEGTLSATLVAPTPTSAGTVAVAGAAAPTLAAPTLSAAGAVAVVGAATPTLTAPASTAAGTVAVVGTLSATLAAPTLTAAGTSGSVGTATITLAAPASTAAGTVAVAGETTPTLTAPAPTAAGTVAVVGTATPALAVPTPTAAGTVSLSGSAGVTLALPALAAAGAVAVTAELAAALAGYTLTAAGTVAESSDLTATLAVTLDGPTLTAAGRGRRRAFDPAGDMALFDADRSMIDPSSDMDYFD